MLSDREKIQSLAGILAGEALEVLDLFRTLGDTERERVYGFVHDALERQTDPQAARRFTVFEMFGCFAAHHEDGDSEEQIRYWLDLTPNQYERYLRAWESVQAIHDEVNAFCEEQYGGEENRP